MTNESKYALYGMYLALNRAIRVIRDAPDFGYNNSIIEAFEDLKEELEEQINKDYGD